MARNSRYTYAQFAQDVIRLASGENLTAQELDNITTKAQDLAKTHENKAAYNKANPKKTAPKGASETTQANANAIGAILPTNADNAMTTADINEKLNTDFSPLQVSNAIRFIPNAQNTKVVRKTTNAKGLTSEREYTAYYIG